MLWSRISNIGINEKKSFGSVKNEIMMNQINFIMLNTFGVIILMEIILYLFKQNQFDITTYRVVVCLGINLINLYLAKRELFNAIRLNLILTIPFFLILFPTLFKEVYNEYFILNPSLAASYILIPGLIYPYKERDKIFKISFAFILILTICVDLFVAYKTGFSHPLFVSLKPKLPLYKIIQILIFMFIFLSITYLNKNNQLYEHQLIDTNMMLRSLTRRLKSITRDLNKRNKKLYKLCYNKDMLLSIIAHDIRNPLGASLGFSRILHKDYENLNDLEKKEYIKLIHESSVNLNYLIDDLQKWSLSLNNRIQFAPKKISISELVNDVIDLLKPSAYQKKIRLMNSIPRNISITADKNMIFTILRNLVSNAIKFSFKSKSVTVTAKQDHNQTIVFINDQGIGIKKKNIGRLFQTNHIFSTPGTNYERGCGLGLLLCKEFIEKHNGTIGVKSEYRKGSEFWFTIPVTS